jgi:hypothetical protein
MRRLAATIGTTAVLAVLTVGASVSSAQDLTLGYQLQRFSGGSDSQVAPAGFDVEASYPLTPMVAVVGGVDFSHKSDSGVSFNYTAFAGGLRFSPATTGTAKPFFQVRGGVMRLSASTDFAGSSVSNSDSHGLIDFGVGAAMPLSGRLDGVAEVFYRRIFTPDEGTNDLGFVLGVRIPLHP